MRPAIRSPPRCYHHFPFPVLAGGCLGLPLGRGTRQTCCSPQCDDLRLPPVQRSSGSCLCKLFALPSLGSETERLWPQAFFEDECLRTFPLALFFSSFFCWWPARATSWARGEYFWVFNFFSFFSVSARQAVKSPPRLRPWASIHWEYCGLCFPRRVGGFSLRSSFSFFNARCLGPGGFRLMESLYREDLRRVAFDFFPRIFFFVLVPSRFFCLCLFFFLLFFFFFCFRTWLEEFEYPLFFPSSLHFFELLEADGSGAGFRFLLVFFPQVLVSPDDYRCGRVLFFF